MQVTIKDVLGDQLRLAYSDSVYADLDVGADGVLTITPTGEALELVASVGVGSLGVGGVAVVTAERVLQNVTANAAILTAGTLDDARVAESNVTQHQGALSIGWGQITGAPDYLDQAAADLLYAPLEHEHDAGDIETGTLAVARGGTGLGALGDPLQILRVNAGGTGLEYATSVTDAFAKIGNGAGVEKFAASGADMLRFAAGSDLAVAFDEATNKITISYVGGGTGGITSAYTELAVGATSATASGADTATFAASGNGLTAALDVGSKTITYTLDEAALSIAASQLTGTIAAARIDLAAGYDWTGLHSFSKVVSLTEARASNGLRARWGSFAGASGLGLELGTNGDTYAYAQSYNRTAAAFGPLHLYATEHRFYEVSGEIARLDGGILMVGTTLPGNATAGGIRATGISQFDAALYLLGLPTSNPGGSGRVWNDGGTLKIT